MAVIGGYGQSGSYPAVVDRRIITAGLTPASGSVAGRRAGVLRSASKFGTGAGGSMNLTISTGQCVLAEGYIIENASSLILTHDVGGSSARTDLIVARMYDTEAGDSTTGPAIEIVKGVSSAVPATPARALALYRVAVPAGASSITSANITDVRVYTGSAGGPIHIPGAVASPGLASGLEDGTLIWDSQANLMAVRNASQYVTPIDPRSVGFGAARMGHSGAQNANTGVWKVLDMTFTDFVEGSGMTAGPSGVQVTSAGQYQVSAKFIVGGNPQGRRLIGLGTRAGRLVEQSISAVSASDMSMALSFEITVPAGGVIAPWVYQDSGLTLLVSQPQLTARRVS